jgi:hypothetical protein
VRSCVVFGPDGVALDQGPTRCWHRMPSEHARAPLLTTTTGLATLATVAASPAACSPLRRVGREALAGPTPAWQYDHPQLSSSGRRGSRVDRRVGADAGRGCGDDRAGVSLRRCWPSSGCEDFLYELKAGPAGGRLRRPSSRRQDRPAVRRLERCSRDWMASKLDCSSDSARAYLLAVGRTATRMSEVIVPDGGADHIISAIHPKMLPRSVWPRSWATI